MSARTEDLAHSDPSLKQMQLRRATLQGWVYSTGNRRDRTGTWAHPCRSPSQPKPTAVGLEESRVSLLSPSPLTLCGLRGGTRPQFPGINILCCTQPFLSRSGNNPEADFMSAFLFRKWDCARLAVFILGSSHDQPCR